MNEHIADLLVRIINVLYFFEKYQEAKRLTKLAVWLRDQDVPEDI